MTVQRYYADGDSCSMYQDPRGTWVRANDYDDLAAKLEQYKDLCAAMYQMAGLVGAPERFLDALHDAASGEILVNPIDSLLPVDVSEFAPGNLPWMPSPDYVAPIFQEQVEAHTHIGSDFDEVLKEDGILEEVTVTAQSRVAGFYNGKALCYSMMTTTGDRWVLDKVAERDWEFFSDAVAWGNANGYLVEMESSLPKEHQDDTAN